MNARSLGIVCLSIIVVGLFMVSSLPSKSVLSTPSVPVTPSLQSHAKVAATYLNTNDAALWVRKNGSDLGYPYPGANVTPISGMNYFGTKTIQVSQYTFNELNDSTLFPIWCREYVGMGADAASATYVADNALTNPRIMGMWIDDFPVAIESQANMSAISVALHHNDIALGRVLTLGVVVYQRDYYRQTPNSWASISQYIDIVHFWLYPTNYGSLWANFAGYETAFHDLQSMLPSTMEYWAGIYLHYYNVGTYPTDMIKLQLDIAGRLIKDGQMTKLSILENFWIQHNGPIASLVRDYLNAEITPSRSSVVTTTNGAITSVVNGISTSPMVHNLTLKHADDWTMVSDALQNVSLTGMTGSDIRALNTRTGDLQDCRYFGSSVSFWAQPGETYRVRDLPLTNQAITTPTNISTPTAFVNKRVYVNTTLTISSKLWVNNSIFLFGPTALKTDYMKNASYGPNGLFLSNMSTVQVRIRDSVLDATYRQFPWQFEIRHNTGSSSRELYINNATLSCIVGLFSMVGYTYVYDTTIYSVQPGGGNNFGVWWGMPGINFAYMARCLIWEGVDPGSVGFYSYVSNSLPYDALRFNNNTVVGGSIGMWLDNSWAPGTLHNNAVYGSTTRYHVEGTTDGNRIRITASIRLVSDIAITGNLTSSAGAIGTYSTALGVLDAKEMIDAELGSAVVIVNPRPWTFSITSALPSGYYYMVGEASTTMNESRPVWQYPDYLSLNGTSFAIYGEQVFSLHLYQKPMMLLTGTTNHVNSKNMLSVSDSLHNWTLANWTNQQAVRISAVTNKGVLMIWSISYSPTAKQSDAASWYASHNQTGGTMSMRFANLLASQRYTVSKDGVVQTIIQSDSAGIAVWTYTGSWSNHHFILTPYSDAESSSTLKADFSFRVQGNTVTFLDTSKGNDVYLWLWDFGDGKSSTIQDPTHVYASQGTFHVKLTVSDSSGRLSSMMKDVVIGAGAGPGFLGTTLLLAIGLFIAGALIIVITKRPSGAVVGAICIVLGIVILFV